jgi:hypothetical protein
MVSFKSWAWFSVLKPAFGQYVVASWQIVVCLRTLVAVDECILDYHRPSICCRELLCLPPRLPECTGVLDMIVGAHATRYTQYMAG